MKISEVAAHTHLSIDTIRYYEKRGLLDSEHFTRLENGYRDYSEAAILRLELIRHGQTAGFTLHEMVTHIKAWESNEMTPEAKCEFFDQKIEIINAQIEALCEVRQYIRTKMAMMRSGQLT